MNKKHRFKAEPFQTQNGREFIEWLEHGLTSNYFNQASAIAEVNENNVVSYHTFLSNNKPSSNYFGLVVQSGVKPQDAQVSIGVLANEFAVPHFQSGELQPTKIIVIPNESKGKITYDLIVPNQTMLNLGYSLDK